LTDQWYTANVESQTWWYSESVLKHFVIDTSRMGKDRGHLLPILQVMHRIGAIRLIVVLFATDSKYRRPLLDAYLWVKIPGESDGQCYRWTNGPLDPVRNMMDPAAGQWFPQMALELVHNANPLFHKHK